MKHGTRPKGWHDDFASDGPEHAICEQALDIVEGCGEPCCECADEIRALMEEAE